MLTSYYQKDSPSGEAVKRGKSEPVVAMFCRGIMGHKYPLFISEQSDFSDFSKYLPIYKKIFIICDQVIVQQDDSFIRKIKGRKFIMAVEANERNKSFSNLEYLCQQIISKKPARDDLMLLVGGGVILNLGGLCASLIMRGLKFIYVPTTLTGQIDVCMGSKQAVNFYGAKNMIGLYNDPLYCYVNSRFLSTLSDFEFNSQLVEGLKLCLCLDKGLFLSLLGDISYGADRDLIIKRYLRKLIELKLRIVDVDLKEENIGLSMLYGHSIGHAIEVLSDGLLNHGVCVGLGMLAASQMAYLCGLSGISLVNLHRQLLINLGLPTKIPASIKKDQILAKLKYNKHNYGTSRFILLSDIGLIAKQGKNYYQIIPKEIIDRALTELY